MRKLVAVLALGSLLTLGLSQVDAHAGGGGSGSQATVVTVQCSSTTGLVTAVQSSAGVTVPATVVVGEACAQAVADLLNGRFRLSATYDVSGAGPFFLFSGRVSSGD